MIIIFQYDSIYNLSIYLLMLDQDQLIINQEEAINQKKRIKNTNTVKVQCVYSGSA